MSEPILLRIDPFLWNDESLNYPEKIILNLVYSFTIREECFEIPNAWIASKFGWTPSFVGEVIAMLQLRQWINVHVHWDGTRCISINIPGKPDPCDTFQGIIDAQV